MTLSTQEVERLQKHDPITDSPAEISSDQAARLWANVPFRKRLLATWVYIVIVAPLALVQIVFFDIYRWDRKTQSIKKVGRWGKFGLLCAALLATVVLIEKVMHLQNG